MTQPPARHEPPHRPPGIPIWVWILVLIVVIAALWWILADRPAANDDEPLAAPPAVVEEPATGAGYGAGEPLTTGTGGELGTEPIEEPQPPPP